MPGTSLKNVPTRTPNAHYPDNKLSRRAKKITAGRAVIFWLCVRQRLYRSPLSSRVAAARSAGVFTLRSSPGTGGASNSMSELMSALRGQE